MLLATFLLVLYTHTHTKIIIDHTYFLKIHPHIKLFRERSMIIMSKKKKRKLFYIPCNIMTVAIVELELVLENVLIRLFFFFFSLLAPASQADK